MSDLKKVLAGLMASLLNGADKRAQILADENVREDREMMRRLNDTSFTQGEYIAALGVLMTGPKATRPRWRAIRKTIARMRNGGSIKGGWRSWPSKECRT